MDTIHKAFESIVPEWKDINFGIILISIYYILDLGSIQGLFPVVAALKIPYIVSAVSVIYALILSWSNAFDRKSGVTRSLFCLLLFVVIYSMMVTGNPVARDELIKVCAIYFANYIIVVSKVRKVSQFIFLLDVWLLAIAFSSYNGSFQGGLIWGSRWLNDENQMATLAGIAFPFAIVLMALHRSKLKKLYYLFCIFNYSFVTVIAHSRGGVLGLVIAILLCLGALKNKVRNFLLILLIVAVTISYAPPIFFNDMATLEQGTQEQTADDRIYLWGIALHMFADHPIFGIGPMNYSFYFADYEQGVRYNSKYRVAHSTPIEFLSETGVVGMFLFLLLQYQLYKNWECIGSSKGVCARMGNSQDFHYIPLIAHACFISQIVFYWCALFLTLFMFPFYWCLLPLSEVWKNIGMEEVTKISS